MEDSGWEALGKEDVASAASTSRTDRGRSSCRVRTLAQPTKRATGADGAIPPSAVVEQASSTASVCVPPASMPNTYVSLIISAS